MVTSVGEVFYLGGVPLSQGALYDCPDPLCVGFTVEVPAGNHVFLISKLLGSAQAGVSHTYSLMDLVLPTSGGATESSDPMTNAGNVPVPGTPSAFTIWSL